MANLSQWGKTSNIINNGGAENSTVGWSPDKKNSELENNRGAGEGVDWRAITKPDRGSNQSTLRAVNGSCFFSPKLDVTSTEMHTDLSQTVDVNKFSQWIDTGEQTFDFSGYHAGDGGDDKAQIFLKMMDISGNVLKCESSSKTNSKSWQPYNLPRFKLPKNTKQIKIVLRASKSFGIGHNYYCSYFESLQLIMPIFRIPVTVSASTVKVGSTVKITPDPGFNFSGISYESLTPAIASVDYIGNVKGLLPGIAKIKIKDPRLPEVGDNIVTITVISAPIIDKHPVNKTVNPGEDVKFSVAVISDPAPTFQWQVSTNNGATWANVPNAAPYSNATSATLTITAVTNALNGNQYKCIITNTIGTVQCDPATLTVRKIPVITTHPTNQTVISGQNAAFVVFVTGNPKPTFQWQLSTNGSTWINIINDDIYSGATSGGFIIKAATNALTGNQYRCVVTNSAGTAISNAVILTVVTAGATGAPIITTQPSDVTASTILIKPVTFTIAAKGDPKLMYQWQESPEGKFWTNITNNTTYSGATSDSLTVKPTSALNGYKYRCVVANSAGSATSNAATLTLSSKRITLTETLKITKPL